MGSDRHQMSFVDGFELQKVAAASQIVIPNSDVSLFTCLEILVCESVVLKGDIRNSYVSKARLHAPNLEFTC